LFIFFFFFFSHPHLSIENSISKYLFVCTNPRVLILPQQITGQHKLWQLSSNLLSQIQTGLKTVSEKWRLSLNNQIDIVSGNGLFDLFPTTTRPQPDIMLLNAKVKPVFEIVNIYDTYILLFVLLHYIY
jgi:hypothetical protein